MNPTGPHALDLYIGVRLRTQRKLLGYSQSALGKTIGVTFQQVQKYERGTNSLAAWRLFELATVLQVSPMYFLEDYQSAEPIVASPVISTQTQHLVADFLSLPAKLQHSTAAFVHELAKSMATRRPKKAV